jgi:CRP/FNR family transcriptional regulator, cyclic AMP receptor protein
VKRIDPVVAMLRSMPQLDGIDDRSLARLVPLVDEAAVDAGRRLIGEGTAGRQAFLIVEGRGRVSVGGKQVASVGAGEVLGEMSLLDHRPRSATVVAETPMRLLVVGPSAFGSFIEHPGMARAVAIQLSERLRRAEAAPVC